MKKFRLHAVLVGALLLALGIGSYAVAGGGKKHVKGDLTGLQENPDISTTGNGTFEATIDDDAQTIAYELSYSALEGGAALQAHIHLGKRAVNGGVSAFLCGGGDKPACPATSGTVNGVVDAADVIGPGGQGIAAGEFGELVAAMRAGHTYANVHTPTWPSGEIRAQINDRKNDD